MSNYGSPHRKNSATVITVSAPKLAYVKAVQGKPMECRQCGHRFKEDDEAVAAIKRLDEIEQEFNWKLRRMEERE